MSKDTHPARIKLYNLTENNFAEITLIFDGYGVVKKLLQVIFINFRPFDDAEESIVKIFFHSDIVNFTNRLHPVKVKMKNVSFWRMIFINNRIGRRGDFIRAAQIFEQKLRKSRLPRTEVSL